MDKTAIGRKIKELRKVKGYSQFQLGARVGVSDKAVSKWETGKAVPDRPVCEKLSWLLGFDFDTMVYDNLTPEEAEKLAETRRKALWEKAEQRMKEIYGDTPPLAVFNRFILERNAMRHANGVILFDILGQVHEKARQRQAGFDAPGAECFTGWLLGATRTNPLEPHRYCEKCHRVEFHPEAQDGWDLPAKRCECGAWMNSDGHNIPWIPGEMPPYEFYMCNTDESFLKEAEETILSYGEQFFAMERYHEDAEDFYETTPEGEPVIDPETGEKIRLRHLPMSALMFRLKKKAKVRKPERISGPAELMNWGKQLGLSTIVLLGGFYGPYYLGRPSVFRSRPEELAAPEVLEYAAREWREYLPVWLEDRTKMIIPETNPVQMTFCRFVSFLCAVHCAYMVSGPEELARKTGFGDWTELPLSVSDLWNVINRSTAYPGYMSGTAGEILKKVSTGKYTQGIPDSDRKLFTEMNLPEWFADYAESIIDLSSRSECTGLAIRLLEDARQKIRDEKRNRRT